MNSGSEPQAGQPLAQYRLISRWLFRGLVGLLLLVSGWLLRSAWQSWPGRAPQGKPVAAIGKELIYEKDFLPSVEAQLQKVRMAEYDAKRNALDVLINKRLVEAEAARRGMQPEELVLQEADSRVPEPDESEVEQAFYGQLFQGGGANESRESIRDKLKSQKVGEARREFFQRLRDQAQVKVYLLPPAVDVAYDPARVRGDPHAKVTIVEFSDFHCPFCRKAYPMMKNLLQKYDGKVKLAYRDLPLMEVDSELSAAEASRCAGEQGQFWPYHDRLFENQDGYDNQSGFESFAKDMKLNVNQFRQCLQARKYKDQVKQDFQDAIRLGAAGTPYFFVNGVPVNGARPQSEFESLIETQLAALQ